MCGLFGHTLSGVPLETSRAALNVLSQRGPDQSGEWVSEDMFVGHRRLSILDLSENGRQPMSDATGSIVISVNGEIYNYRELKAQLADDFRFRSDSDSEVILHGYVKWGMEGLLKRLEGMFAFSVCDMRTRTVYLARDRVGIKPMLYTLSGPGLVWASELKAFRRLAPHLKLDRDWTAMYDFLTYGYIPGAKTVYKNVAKLPPGHYLEYRIGGKSARIREYWRLKADVRPISIGDACDQAKALIRESVRAQLVSDVPVGLFLSGGIDSSVIAYETARAGLAVDSYTIGFRDRQYDESRDAAETAIRFNGRNEVRYFEPEAMPHPFRFLYECYDEPFGDTSAFSTYMVSKLARSKCAVVLSGDGGDEVFGGYTWYGKLKSELGREKTGLHRAKPLLERVKNAFWGRPIGKMAGSLEGPLLTDDLEVFTRMRGGMIKNEKTRYAKGFGIPDGYDDYWYYRKFYRTDLPVLTRLQYLDFHTFLPDAVLTKVDRSSMAVSLEARVPFLHTPILDFAFSLPESIRYSGSRLKGVLKDAYKEELGREILGRRKKGFSVPSGLIRKEIRKGERYNYEIMLRKYGEHAGLVMSQP